MRGSKLQKRSKATFDILMAKYKEGKAGIRGGAKTGPSGIPCGRYGLLHQVDGSCPIEEHDA
jgi:hypothetical protein